MLRFLRLTLLTSFFLLVSSIYFPIFATDFTFSLSPSFGIKSGEMGEYVFLKDCSYSDDKLSYLQWNFKNPYIALESDMGYKAFSIENKVSYGFGAFTDSMTDSDWQNVCFSALENCQYKTNYSESDNFTKRDVSVSTKASLSFFPLDWLCLKPLFALDFEYMRFAAKGGKYYYGKQYGYFYYKYNDSKNNSTGSFSGDVLWYRRWSLFTWLGFGAKARLFDKISLEADFFISPYSFALDIDTHCLTSTRYIDIIETSFNSYKISLSLITPLAEKSEIGLNFSFLSSALSRGKTYSKDLNSHFSKYLQDTSSECGMDEKTFNISLFYKFYLF